ncbi:hypothetical protein [Marinoscillum luteum]|uniref:DUF1858 domain-containing protein n=1 Tax=Marinoscillum luteum TaxID=861051 RepID=A0ABW7NAU1_9BACT
MTYQSRNILESVSIDLPLSEEFKAFMELWGFENLNVMLSQFDAGQLLKKQGFSCHCLVELYTLLESNGVAFLLKE